MGWRKALLGQGADKAAEAQQASETVQEAADRAASDKAVKDSTMKGEAQRQEGRGFLRRIRGG